jgi:molecular chaperone DnaJ
VKDPYELLGVSRSATADEIKSAFKKLAAKHHPDKNPDDADASQRFKEINAAYQILSDPKKRAVYDRFGAAGLGGAGAGGPFGGIPVDFGEIHVDGIFADLLEALGIRIGERGDVQLEAQVSFEEAAFGCSKTLSYERVVPCADCDGSGAARGSELGPCTACNGRGRVRYQQGVFPIAVERSCSRCGGQGRVVLTPCAACRGTGSHGKHEQIEVAIPPGVETGSTRRVAGKGNATRNRRTGDLEVVVRVKPHPLFRRSGDNVVCTLPITFPQATLGDEIEIPTLDGKGVLRIPPGTQPGTTLRVKGKGIPRRVVGGRGDQLVEVHVEIPTTLTDRQREIVVELSKELGESVQPQRRSFIEKLRDLFE